MTKRRRPAPRREKRSRTAPRVDAVGVDTGGTFTDFVARVGGALVAFKLPSTPARPERAVLAGLRRLGVSRSTRVRHGSTVATNALLERKGARVALATTAGFEDVLEIGRQHRPDLYALAPRRIEPLVPSERRFGVAERTGPRGERWQTLTRAAADRLVAEVRAARPEAVAVSLLHSYADGAHERRLGSALAKLRVPLTLSSELCPEFREYERTATTVTNAYLMPRVAGYLSRLARGTAARLEIVLSHGGTAPPALAAREPVRQLLSGPAGGLQAARVVARACGFQYALTLDVGGTSTDCAFISGEMPRRRAREIAGFPVQLPILDVHTIGAGGGSIARVDAGGLLHVGPESAGASPGPACYGRGGPPTLTDALVVLGRIPGERLAGGALALDRDAARRAMERVAKALGSRDPLAAATGVVRLAEANMSAALRRVSVEQGHDPRGAALVAFGGAGGLHAAALAETLGGRTVLFPHHAGVLSALGALSGGSRREASRSVLVAAADAESIVRVLAELERRVRADFERSERARVRVARWADVRYHGQSHELSLPVAAGLIERFHREHERRYGFAAPELPVEVVTLEVRGEVAAAEARLRPKSSRRASGTPAPTPEATLVHESGRAIRAGVWRRAELRAGWATRGPAVVLEDGATLWIPPRWRARLHSSGTVVVER